jgi:putative transposase
MKKTELREVQRGKPVFTIIADPRQRRRIWSSGHFGVATQPSVGGWHYLRAHLAGLLLHRLRHRCKDRRLGSRGIDAYGELPLQAFNHAVWQSDSTLSELIHHSDRGSQYLSLAHTDRLAELGVAPSVGSRGDNYEALAGAVNAAYKTELINRPKPRRCIGDVELSTAQWVAWYNQERLHEALGYVPPAEFEATLHRRLPTREPADPGPRNRLGLKPGVVHFDRSAAAG